MTPERWREIERLYYASIELSPEHQHRVLAECDDAEIRDEVTSLLAHRDRNASFIQRPALDVAAEILARDSHELFVGRTIGHYEILSLIGAGGMGVVYRARDLRLGRDVALKLFPSDVGSDSRARFEQEARLLASLQHPNIGGIYDLEESGGVGCLVLEYIEGETLADRLWRRRMHADDALTVCGGIAEALEAAHQRGIVHRDLKPSNVMITPSGSIKVLDFGIARMLDADMVSSGAAAGTPAYMSPEQAAGTPADTRTDVWAFGCVLYEVLTGKRAFEKPSVAETLAAVAEQEPDWDALPAGTPPRVADLVRRCLQKNPHWRLRDIGDARIELVEQRKAPREQKVAEPPTSGTGWFWIAAAAVVVVAAAALVVWPVPSRRLPGEVRLEVTTPPTADAASLAVSPDGRKLVFVATHEGRSRLWLRSLDSLSSRPIEQTDHASCPFWSPDSNAVGFFADGRLKHVDVASGAVHDVVGALSCGGAWNRDGTILYASPLFGPISRVSASGQAGAAPTSVTRLDLPRERAHRLPQFLPDQQHFLYYAGGQADARGVYVGDLNGAESRRLLDADTAAVYASGHLMFVRQGALFAQAFDATSLTLRGDAFQIADHVMSDPARYLAAVSSSSSSEGVIVYRRGSVAGRRQFVWVDRAGREQEKIGDPDGANALDPSLSPDLQRIAFHRTVNSQPDLWLLDVKRGVRSRFTTDGRGLRPIWSPDGGEIVYAAGRPTNLVRRGVTGEGGEKLLLATSQPKAPTDWSADGRYILYRSNDPQNGWDVWALPLNNPGQPIPVARTQFDEREAQFSPDAKWVAYQSNESGRFEIYVQSFLRPGNKTIVSRHGGGQVRWRADGKELFYVAFDSRLVAVPVQFANGGETIGVGAPVSLFATHMGGAIQGPDRQQYMVSPDGQRFLMNTVVEDAPSPIVVILNWNARH